jgi:membrane protease YdiL (CAAX protease family)
MAGCGLAIAAVALPIAFLARSSARKRGEPLLPKPRRWPVPWSGFELLVLFPFAFEAPSALIEPFLSRSGFYEAVYGADAPDAAWVPMRPLWDAVFFVPLFAGLVLLLRHTLYQDWKSEPWRPSSIPARTALGVFAWLAIHPPVWIVHFIVSVVFFALSWTVDEHPLEKSFREGRPAIDNAVFIVQVCVLTPILEELLFRGLLLPWIFGRKHRAGLVVIIAAVVSVPLAALRAGGDWELMLGPIAFAILLLAGWFVFHRRHPRKQRSRGAIYASAVLFALVHTSVWPTPIPLFVLGLGLGWLALRTRGILAPAIVHGLFNAVSVLFVLRG